jgi:acyl-CoA dehydrogenase
MNLDFSEEQHLLGDQLRRFLGDYCPTEAVCATLDGSRPHARALYEGLAGLGALGAAIPERYGGAGLGQLELCIVAQELGRALAPAPVSSSIYLAANFLLLAGDEQQKMRLLPALANGQAIGTLALTERAGAVHVGAIETVVRCDRISGTKLAVPDGQAADFAVVVARDADHNGPDSSSLYLVDLEASGVAREPVETIDPTRSYSRLTFENAPAEALGTRGQAWAYIERVYDRAAVLMAFEQVGGAERALELARDYALERIAFGRPIGSFQALKHMMADMYVAATLARSNVYYGAWALSTEDDELPVAAATARLSASQAFLECAKNNIQVHGGMGFSWESPCHLYYRRANALSLSLGPYVHWQELLIRRLQARAAKRNAKEARP